MEITEVKVFPVNEEKLKAFVSIVFDQCFMVNDVKIIQGRDGLFISMPSRKKKNGDYKDVAHPLNTDTRSRIQDRILSEYRLAIGIDGENDLDLVEDREPERPAPSLEADESVPAPAAEELIEAPPALDGIRVEPSEAPAAVDGQEVEPSEEKTLDEVAKRYSSDSFWTA